MRHQVFGIETEYELTTASPSGDAPVGAEHAARQLFESLLHQGRSSDLFLHNGGRLYPDAGAHPEYTTAECDRLEDLLEQDHAGASVFVDLAIQADEALSELGSDLHLHLFRNNPDLQGDSYGYHEDYLLHRRRDYRQVTDVLIAFFVARQILVSDKWINTAVATPRLQFSQRAGQMWDAVSSTTTHSRPVINTRDETLADSGAYRRMHVIVGDTSVTELTTVLKISITELFIHTIEDGLWIEDLSLVDPIRAIHEINPDLPGSTPLELANGRTTNAVTLQREVHERVLARILVAELGPMRAYAVDLRGRGIDAIASGDWSSTDTEPDIVIKHKLLTSYCACSGANITDPRVARLRLSYSDIAADDLWEWMERARLMRRLATIEGIHRVQAVAPATTHTHLRGCIIATTEGARANLSVDQVHVCLDESSTTPLSLQDPLATTDPRVDTLIAQIDSRSPAIPA